MKNFIIAFFIFLIWSFFGIWLYSWLNPSQEKKEITQAKTNLESTEKLPLVTPDSIENSIRDTLDLSENIQPQTEEEYVSNGLKATNAEGDVVFLFPKGIQIFRDSAAVFIPPEALDFKYKINTYLIEHPKEEVQILALYAASEKIANPNLGTQRGNAIKAILREVGISRERIAVKSMIKPINFDEQGVFPYGISFIFSPIDSTRVNLLKFKLPDDKTMYPKLINNDIFVNEELKALLEEAQNVLQANPNVHIEIIGHTDNIGNANDNYLLALQYARQVRWYLITKGGLDKDRVLALSEGEAKSIADNNTERGRFLNRRLEIKYKTN
ncbi:MAG: OmpA family protein [Flavobacteriaceae bacterium]